MAPCITSTCWHYGTTKIAFLQVEGHLNFGAVKQPSSHLQCSQGVKKPKQQSISFDHSYSLHIATIVQTEENYIALAG